MSRRQLVAGAADMIRWRGLNATSIREVAKHAGTPLGSTYHYFPGGHSTAYPAGSKACSRRPSTAEGRSGLPEQG